VEEDKSFIYFNKFTIMKKVIFTLLVAISFMACEGPEGPMGPAGQDGRPGLNGQDGKDGQNGQDGKGTKWYTTSFTVNQSDWKLSGKVGDLNSYFYADKNLPQLDDFVFAKGTVIGYIEPEPNVKNGLPFVLHKGDILNSGQEVLWTETYDFDYSDGLIRFYLTYSDFSTNIPAPTQKFHIVLMWE